MTELISQFTKFPLAETIHLLQGAIAGILVARGYHAKAAADMLAALLIMVGFAIYEGFERWRINDNADIDFQVFLIVMWIAGLGAHAWLKFSKWRHHDK